MSWILASLLIIGVILAGYDGSWFPYINLVGAVVLGVFAVGMMKVGRE